jgi:hypothetical protein
MNGKLSLLNEIFLNDIFVVKWIDGTTLFISYRLSPFTIKYLITQNGKFIGK